MALPIVETPKYELTVPSTGQKVEYRPYLVKEEKILILALESKDDASMIRAVRDVIGACTDNKISVDDLAIFDLEYIFLKLRSVSVGSISDIKLKCEKCEEFIPAQVNLEEVEIKGEIIKNYKVQLTNNVGVTMKYPTVKGVLRQSKGGEDGFDAIISMILASMDTIYDVENVYDVADSTKEELIAFIESLNQEQFSKLTEFFTELPSLKTDIDTTCPSCGTHQVREINGLRSFF